MKLDDTRFENFLREFQPKPPRALPAVVERKPELRRLAAAAVVLATVGASTWLAIHETQPLGDRGMTPAVDDGKNMKFEPVRHSLFSLTQLAVEDPSRLDMELTDQSRRVLPNFRNKESTLRVLSNQ